jgi:heptaprenyl diphosphate synthase/octaprenyl-diphosphate synthase
VVEGELSPVTRLEPLNLAMDQYIYKTGCKTAALFVASCKAGIAVAGGTPEQIEAVGRFGYDLGLAFQIVDDVLDFVGDEVTLGKPAGNDLREGTWTLPLLYAVDSSNDPALRAVVQTGHVDPEQVPYLVDLVIKTGGVARAMSEARYIAERALRHLDIFPPSPTKRALADICEFVLARRS